MGGQTLAGRARKTHIAHMERQSNAASRDVVRAVLETRDHRDNETHAMLVSLFQSLVAELVEQGVLAPAPLAERLSRAEAQTAPDPHGAGARSILAHVVAWLRAMEPGLPPSHPARWYAAGAPPPK